MSERINFSEFGKVEMRVGLITAVQDHPNADKLFVLTVDFGEDSERTIVSGLRGYYSREELEGKKAVFVVNLEPAKLRGVESNGMILAAANKDHSDVKILIVDDGVEVGTRIS